MSVQYCAVTGVIQDLLGNNVSGCTVSAFAPVPFFHDSGVYISGQIDSVTTGSDGAFSLSVIETATCGQSITFQFDYYDGVSGRRKKAYSVVVPNVPTATLFSLIGTTAASTVTPVTVPYGGTGVTSLPQYAVLLGSGLNSVQSAAPATAGYPLCSNGAAANPSFQQLNLASVGVTGVLPNANTTATAANTASAIMARDGSGQVAATTFTGDLAGNAATVTTNANLTGDVTSVGNATTLTNAPVIAKVLTGYTSGAGTVSATDSILQAIQKLNGNDATNANLTGDVTSVGNATTYNNALPASKGGTGATASSATPAASANVLWDANSNLSANNLIDGFTTTALAGSTTTMTIASTGVQVWTGSGTTAQTVKLPTTGVAAGAAYTHMNTTTGTGALAVQSSGANAIASVPAGFQGVFTALVATPTTAANWSYSLSTVNNATPPTGTVTSVTFTGDGTVLSSTPSTAVTTSGTVTAALKNQNASLALMGPAYAASAAAPTFRAIAGNDLATTVQSKSTTYSVLATDDEVICSGASWTATLPAANGVPAGKVITFIHNDSSLSRQYTISRAGSDTINGATSTTIATQYEILKLQSDGTSVWYIVARSYPSAWTSYTPTYGAGFGTVASTSYSNWRRVGDSIQIRGTATAGTVAGSVISLTLPSGLTGNESFDSILEGSFVTDWTGGTQAGMFPLVKSASPSLIQFAKNNSASGFTPINGNGVMINGSVFSWVATIRVVGWN